MSVEERCSTTLFADLPRDQPLLVGVSGGRDSMCLWRLLILADFSNLLVCHLNHLLRGAESNEDEAFVNQMAKDWGCPIVTERRDIGEISQERKQSIETCAREERFQFFATIAAAHNAAGVVLAHHCDDQVETVIMNFFRGTGLRGLRGMRPKTTREELPIFRPLLNLSRKEIDETVSQFQIPYREDRSNANRQFLRNRVRQDLLPFLTKLFRRDIRAAVLRLGEISTLEEDYLREQTTRVWSRASRENGSQIRTSDFHELHQALQQRLILHWLSTNNIPNCGWVEVQRIRSLALSKDKPAKVNLPGDFCARRRSGVLFLEKLIGE